MVERWRSYWQHGQKWAYGHREPICPLSVLHGEMPICTCGEGQDVGGMPLEYAGFRKFATRIAIPALSAVPFREDMVFDPILQSAEMPKSPAEGQPGRHDGTKSETVRCGHCNASRNDLKACAGCGTAKYCDEECQRKGWKVHKGVCKRR